MVLCREIQGRKVLKNMDEAGDERRLIFCAPEIKSCIMQSVPD